MKKKKVKKRFYLFLILFVLVFLFLSRCVFQTIGTKQSGDSLVIVENDGTNGQKQIRINQTKQIGKIEISNICIKLVDKNKSELSADVKNLSQEYLEPTNVEIRVIDETGNVSEIFGGIITELAGYEPSTFIAYILTDITNAKDIEFKMINNK